ncbi:MAG: c-type cytochrome [Bacteroidia bacterium]
MKRRILFGISIGLISLLMACGDSGTSATNADSNNESAASNNQGTSDEKGIGPIKEVTLNNPLNEEMIGKGKAIFDLKCSSCHKLDGTKVVGPGWSGVTTRRKPEWIMNFIINVDEMLNKDPKAMTMLEECLVRMPNQNLTEQDARNILEFMLNNDLKK